MKEGFVLLFLAVGVMLAAETFQLQSGERVNGTIVSETETAYILATQFGELKIEKSQIKRDNQTIPFSASTYKKDLDYTAYKKYFGIGLGFFIPGMTFMFVPLIFTPMVVEYWVFSLRHGYLPTTYPIALYFSCISVGLISSLISIPFFLEANQYYKKVLRKYYVTFDAGIKKDSLELVMNVSF